MTAPRPVRAISRADLTLAIVNGVIGSAIFGMPAQIAALTGARSPLAHLIAALAVLTIVLCFAEVASRFVVPMRRMPSPFRPTVMSFSPRFFAAATTTSLCS